MPVYLPPRFIPMSVRARQKRYISQPIRWHKKKMILNIANRLTKLRQSLAEKEIDGIFVSLPENRYYLSGFDGAAGYLLVTPQDTVLATDFRYVEQAKIQAPDYQIFQITGNMSDWFPRLVAELILSKLGFEAKHFTFAMYRQLSDILNKAKSKPKLTPVEGLVESLRAIKEPEEIELITQAAEITDKAFEHIESVVHIGMTEKEIAWEIERFMRENGSLPLPFDVIVASGPNAALPHAKPSPRQINSGEPVIIDIGARIGGYASDLSRTICLGTPDDTFKKVYGTVLGAQLTALAIIKEGMSGGEADSLARIVIEKAGYDAAFGHGLGHGVGLAIHEQPRLGPNSTDLLTSGMVFTIEPGIYLTGWGGVRIEDLGVMENNGIRVLSKARKVNNTKVDHIA
ncbi:M24 family metallopeptidase [Chloroflexota bacterium]